MKRISLSKVKISESFKSTKPRRDKIEATLKYILENGTVDKPIVLDGLTLVDGYTRYLAAVRLKMKSIEYIEIDKEDDRLPIRCVVGKFDKKNKEYTWRIMGNEVFNPGDRALVMSTYYDGIDYPMEVSVIRCFETTDPSFRNHKYVISKI